MRRENNRLETDGIREMISRHFFPPQPGRPPPTMVVKNRAQYFFSFSSINVTEKLSEFGRERDFRANENYFCKTNFIYNVMYSTIFKYW